MTRTQFRLLTLSALLSSALAMPALAEGDAAQTTAPVTKQEKVDPAKLEKMKARAEKREQRHAEMFKKTDANGDGSLSKDEWVKAHQKRAEDMFDKIDANKDGKLEPEEMKKGKMAMREKMKEHMKDRGGPGGKPPADAPDAPPPADKAE